MSKPGLSFGLNLAKKPGASKPAPPKRKPMFGGDDDSDDDTKQQTGGPQATSITEFDEDAPTTRPSDSKSKKNSSKIKGGGPPDRPPTGKLKDLGTSVYGDLSSALESKRHREEAEKLDPTIYDYDAVYESLKPEKKETPEEAAERRPKYMKNLMASAAVRKRDALIAEEKKIARERAEEGDQYAGEEKFVTEAYKKQQEENRQIEEEERLREEKEAAGNRGGGMTAFYKDLLEQGDRRHAEVVKAAEERAKLGSKPANEEENSEGREEKDRTDGDVAREINAKGGTIAINEDGQVVDKRELLRGGLNLGAKKQESKDTRRGADHRRDADNHSSSSRGFVGSGGGKQAMRERQTRMLEAQLEQSLKRSMEEEEEERLKVERAAKSRKTDTDISSAKERYLARKKQAEEEKRKKK